MANGGSQPVTREDIISMSRPFEEFQLQMPAPERPALSSQQSNSLPSTPYQHARKLSDEDRVPSPIRGNEISPARDAQSEYDATNRPPGRSTFLSGCKFEKGMASSKRRIPYSIGGDKLERASSMPKKYLEPKEEEKLTKDCWNLYNQLLPSQESEKRRNDFVQKLEMLLNNQWPGNDIRVHVFGSTGNMLYTNESDVDICITTPLHALERVCLLAKALHEHGMLNVVCVPNAKVPIVKIWDPVLELACDMNVNNTLALENTRMIKTYVQIDPRVRPLAMIIKHWTRRRILNDAALGGTLSSYTWICMILNFLQTRNPPILPSLHKKPRRVNGDGTTASFADDIKSLEGFGKENKETLGELLFHFYRRYGHEIDYERNVISIREGQLISKQAKKWHLMQNNRLCVEEPFNTERNLGNTADDISFRGVHLELRRAFDLISEGKLEESCGQYIFPPTEQSSWPKPTPQPRPVLSRSVSQSGRTGKNPGSNGGRGARQNHNNQHRAGTSNRRASSAALNKANTISNGMAGPSNGHQIHDHLFSQYQLLQAQEQHLRLTLHQRAQAQIHAQNTAQGQTIKGPSSPFLQPRATDSLGRHSTIDAGPLSAPLSNMSNIQNMAYFYPQYIKKPVKVTTISQQRQSVHTNPSSPSMTPAQPVPPELRRSLHRSSTANNSFAALRSHSQPASGVRSSPQNPRGMPPNMMNPAYQGAILGLTLQQYYEMMQSQGSRTDTHRINAQAETPRLSSPLIDVPPMEDAVQKEYVGFFLRDSPPSYPSYSRHTPIAAIPSYNDLARKGRSPDHGTLRRLSRSPSPSSMSSRRNRSISFYTASSCVSPLQAGRGVAAPWSPAQHSGPIIADGSGEAGISEYTPPFHEPYFLPGAEPSEGASLSDEPMDTPVTASITPLQEPVELFNLDPPQEPNRGNPMANMLQFGDFPARGTYRTGLSSRPEPATEIQTSSLKVSPTRQSGFDEKANGLGINYDNPTLMNGSVEAINYASGTSPNHAALAPKIDINTSQSKFNGDKPLKPLPLLSPVREVRTPSPTAHRNFREDARHDVPTRVNNSHIASVTTLSPLALTPNGIAKQPQPQTPGLALYEQIGSGSRAAQSFPSGWQQPPKKGKRKGKGNGSISGPSGLPSTPVEAVGGSERKGG